jgi:magnesium chelatase ATPase subunit I
MNSRAASSNGTTRSVAARRQAFPFAALVGQDEMKLALLLNAIDPSVGGVLIMGDRGTGKSTAVRALADLLPPIGKVRDCLYGCDPQDRSGLCADCCARSLAGGKLSPVRDAVPVVDLPLGATEDRVCGTINIERALREGLKVFEPGLLARAHRGFLYIDEVNLLEDHLIDLLLDVAVTGSNRVEREGISIEHPARFVLIGSGNPEEGELRPQLLDRFGLHVEVRTETDLDQRVQIVLAREAFEQNPATFLAGIEAEQSRLRRKLTRARKNLRQVNLAHKLLRRIAELCLQLKIDGHRGELTITRAARALAALEGRRAVNDLDVRRVAVMSLRHRLRRDPLEQTTGGARVEQALDQLFPASQTGDTPPQGSQGGQDQNGPSQPGRAADDARARSATPNGSSAATATANSDNAAPTEQRTRGRDEKRRAPTSQDARLPEVGDSTPASVASQSRSNKKSPAPGQHMEASQQTLYNALRGRYTRAVAAKTDGARIALDATLRATAERGVGAGERRTGDSGRELKDACQNVGTEVQLIRSIGPASNSQTRSPILFSACPELRFKRFKRKVGTLYIFAVDTSGSMAVNRIGQAKGALAGLLRQSYIRRDRVALVCFRDKGAEVLLAPSASVTRAARILDELCIGGPTPLAAGIFSALEIARRTRQQGTSRVVLLLFTDGHANVSLCGEVMRAGATRAQVIWQELAQLGGELQRAGIASVVVDTRNRFTSGGEGERLADELGGRHVYLSSNRAATPELDALRDEIKNVR